MSVQYAAGAAPAVVRGDTLVLLDPDVGADVVEHVWTALASDGADGADGADRADRAVGVVAVVGALTAVSGSVTDVPPFAVVAWDGERSVRVAVRGTAVVVAHTASGPVEVSGRNVLLWAEQVVDDVTAVEVTGADAGDPEDRGWPLVAGVVRASRLSTGPRDAVDTSGSVARAVPGASTDGPADGAGGTVDDGTEADVGRTSVWQVPEADQGEADRGGANQGDADRSAAGPKAAPVPGTGAASPASSGDAGHAAAQDADGVDDAAAAGPSDVAAPGPATASISEETVLGTEEEDYAHLFGETVYRRVEDAAVRVDADDEDAADDEAAVEDKAAASVPAPVPADVEPAGSADAPDESGGSEPLIAGIPNALAPEPGPDGARPALGGAARGAAASTPAAAERAAAIAAVPAAQADVEHQHAESPDGASAAGASPDDDGFDDHDGETLMSSQVAALREAAGTASASAFTAPPAAGAHEVLARSCDQGHANPPTREQCRTCGAALDGEPLLAARPPLGRLRIASAGGAPDGTDVVDLDRDVVVGRRPRTATASADRVPRMVTVASPQHDISRSHVKISLEEWHVLVEDLATTNGTMLLRPGQKPRHLHPNRQELVVEGDVVELGDGVSLTFEGIW